MEIKVLAAIFLFCSVTVRAATPIEITPGEGGYCGWGDLSARGHYGFHNDVWGAKPGVDAEDDYAQCMSRPAADGSVGVEFKWRFKRPSLSVNSYPHVAYGWDFAGPVDAPILPVQVGKLGTLKARYDYEMQSSARYNVSFDIWLSDSAAPARQDIKTELMIWVENNGIKQTRILLESPSISGRTYDFYAGPVRPSIGTWKYTALIAREPVRSGVIDLLPYLRYLKKQNVINDSTYINGISFGAELTEGEGKFRIKDFEISR